MNTDSPRSWGSRLDRTAVALAAIAVLLPLAGGPGYRLGLVDIRTGVIVLPMAAVACAIVGVLIGLAAVVLCRRASPPRWAIGSLAAIALCGAIALQFGSWAAKARSVPPIHDITTDLTNPPEFAAVLPLRQGAANPPGYAGPDVAEQQRAAYPDLTTRTFAAPLTDALEAAEAAARERGWEVVDVDPATGRLEATDTTFWYGFTDDIVVRLTESDGTVRVDVRSKSRVGVSDLGTNAARIRAFLNSMQSRLPEATSGR